MTIISGFGRRPLPSNRQVMQVTPTPESDASINAAIAQSVQEFPSPSNLSSWTTMDWRGPHLPSYGTRERDVVLRRGYRGDRNNLVQAVVSSLIKKIVTVPWLLNGDKRKLLAIADDNGRLHTITEVDHFQNVLQNAQFGAGWEVYLSRYLEDFFTQDFGGVMELTGLGDPIYPIEGPVTGIAQLDAGRCYITGNPYYPIMYFSLISGSLHRMHARRVVRLVDSPSPDERYFGIGLCALSRTIAVANRQQLMNMYIEGLVDDKPAPGIMLTQGFTEKQRNASYELYKREQGTDERPVWGKTMWIYSLDADKPIKAEHFPFSQAPAKFDWVKYTELDVHALAAGFNIDIQEIWELTGRGGAGGNSGQSKTLHQKSEAKMIGFLLQNIERAFNRSVFPPSVTLEFKYNDPVQQETEATVDGQLATNAVALVTGAVWNTLEARTYLAAQSDRYKDAQEAQRDTITALDASDDTQPEDTVTQDVSLPPTPAQPLLPSGQPATPQTGAAPTPPTGAAPKPPTGQQPQLAAGKPKQPVSSPLNAAHASNPRKTRPGNQMPAGIKEIKVKNFSITSKDFERQFRTTLYKGIDGKLDKNAFEEKLLDMLTSGAVKAYADGLRDGGAKPDLTDEHYGDIQDFLVGQIDYIDGLGRQLQDGTVAPEVQQNKAYKSLYYDFGEDENPYADYNKGEKAVSDVFRIVANKARQWVNKSLRVMFEKGRLFADPDSNYMFDGEDGQESCPTCQRLLFQVHPLQAWHSAGLVPRIDTDNYNCGGFKCQHFLSRTDAPERGDF